MVFSDLWQGRTGRIPYLIALVISSTAIAVLPFIAGKITPCSWREPLTRNSLPRISTSPRKGGVR
jgi:hypothetical protein